MFLGHDPDSAQPVVVRTFEVDLEPAVRGRLLRALEQICEAPLQHAAVGRPIACGLADDTIFVVHAYLPGLPVDEWLRAGEGPRPLSAMLLPLSSAAAAIDFAAAAGVHHGALGAGDVIIDDERAGITGWGIEQARASAGLTAAMPSYADDLAAFAAIVAMVTSDAELVREAFEQQRPATALAFVASLQERLAFTSWDAEPAIAEPQPFDAPLRDEGLAPPLDEALAGPLFVTSDAAPRRSGSWLVVAAVAVVMLVAGFAGGIFVGRQQSVTIAPVPAAPVVATSGSLLTDAPVIEPDARAATPHQEAVDRAATPVPSLDEHPQVVSPPSAPAAPAGEQSTLQIDSRPRGAQVFVDGRFVGRTPVVAPGIHPGQHMVRMQMAGHRQWATAVTVGPGERARVGGSLEEQY